MENFIGELTALGAALAFSFTSTFFTLAGRKLGAMSTLAMSLPISLVILMVIHLLTLGEAVPTTAAIERWFYLGVSSIAGFVISSIFLLQAFQYIGPRLTLLIGSLAPVLAAILAWMFLDQALPANSILGIALIITGIVWVVSEGEDRKPGNLNPNYRKGLVYALIASFGQAISFVFSSQGVAGDFHPMSASLMRTGIGAITIWIMLMFQGRLRTNIGLIQSESRSMLFILAASIAGPVIGASLALISLQHTSVGVSATLTNITPIMLIPIGYFVFKERITMRSIVGTVIAIIGIAILFT